MYMIHLIECNKLRKQNNYIIVDSARRQTGRCGEERSSVIPATLHDGKSQRKKKRKELIMQEGAIVNVHYGSVEPYQKY